MKILHITDTYTPFGGVEQYIQSVSRLLESHGHENVIVYLREHANTIYNGSLRSRPAARQPGVSPAGAEELLQVIRQERPDLAYLHTIPYPDIVEAAASATPAVAYVHGFLPTCPSQTKFFRRGDQVCHRASGAGCAAMIYLRRCSEARRPATVRALLSQTASIQQAYQRLDHLIVASHYMRELLRQNGFTQAIHQLAPHFVSPFQSDTRPHLGEPPTILFAGRLEIEKGLPNLLQACAKLSDYRLLIAGDGTQRPAYQALSERLGIAQRVRFLGWLDGADLQKVYAQASLLALPSIFPEPFAKVGIEALSHGLPVVAFQVGGIADWLHNEVNGYLVPPGDTDGLAERLAWLLKNPGLAAQLGAQGRDQVIRDFSPAAHYERLMEIFSTAARQPQALPGEVIYAG